MDGIDLISCAHLRLHDAMRRITRTLGYALIPAGLTLFAVMAWWGQGKAPAWQLLAMLAALLAWALCNLYAAHAMIGAQGDARQLASFHDTVLVPKADRTADA